VAASASSVVGCREATNPTHRWIRLDLTVPNCEVGELRKTIGDMFKAFRRMASSSWGSSRKRAQECAV
jgi:hypothetical protein